MASNVRQIRAKLRELALAMPETHEDLPWGERVVKVKKKVFVFLGRDMDKHLGFSVKLTTSHASALALPFTEPTGYGLGKSGWVSAKFAADAKPSLALLSGWVKESYAAVAPKSLSARVPSSKALESPSGKSSPAAPKKKPPAKKKAAPAKKPPAKKKAAPAKKPAKRAAKA